ncbi:MAG: VWA domain-containing protein [Crocinitomicaceae bacterium]|nr:VWA domain-containing protein [Crocinitomicaceae bacterium]MBK8925479.1 VWA domain-containing protein [Crocinitomicaceae bacterium]
MTVMITKQTQQKILFSFLSIVLFSCTGNDLVSEENENTIIKDTVEAKTAHHVSAASKNTIKLALLLDTSNSMDGLIEQAKSQLWKIVNALSEAKKDDEFATLEIALYEYGNDDLEAREGYVRQVLPFTTDLDTLSHELFALTTNGGEEYCGEVIEQSLEQLIWADDTQCLQVIVIAGNEPFSQGKTNYQNSCETAISNGVFINTIFCGDMEEGIETKWKDGADLAEGYYGNIDMDEATIYIETPFDEEINALNESLNETYIPIGTKGFNKMNIMQSEDVNASYYGSSNSTERVIVKGNKNLYKNSSWDLVDASEQPGFKLSDIEVEELPKVMREMSYPEREKYLEKMKLKREEIQEEIRTLADKREKYIQEKKKEMADSGQDSFEDAIISAVKQQAIRKGFVFDVD